MIVATVSSVHLKQVSCTNRWRRANGHPLQRYVTKYRRFSPWCDSDQDVRYLKPHVLSVLKEEAERKKWDNITFDKK